MQRREFLKLGAAAVAALTAGQVMAITDNSADGRLQRRPYGRRGGVQLSIIGFGGIVVNGVEQDHANRAVARAVERGVNYFDVAPSYGDAEVKLGPALQPYREDAFLACKTTRRDRDGAAEEMRQSFQRLKTDYFDLYQLHAITDVAKDVDAAFAPGGVMQLLVEAKKDGRVRHVGFSAHSVSAAIAALDRYEFDSILIPINFATFYKGNFGPQMIAAAKKRGASVLALKAMAKQKWRSPDDPLRKQYPKCWYEPLTDRHQQALALRFTLSQGVTAAIPPGDESLFWTALDLAMDPRPITDAETQELQQLAEGLDPLFVEDEEAAHKRH